jgi:hypothetical protein
MGRNPYFVLRRGYQLVFERNEGGDKMGLTITVFGETRRIGNVEDRVVEQRETREKAHRNVAENFFATSKQVIE